MPTEDVSDLRDVVEAINKLCETMKTSYDDYEDCEDTQDNIESVEPDNEADKWQEIEPVARTITITEAVSKVVVESVNAIPAQTYIDDRWSDKETTSVVSIPESTTAEPVSQKVEIFISDRCIETVPEVSFSDPKTDVSTEISVTDRWEVRNIVPDVSVFEHITAKAIFRDGCIGTDVESGVSSITKDVKFEVKNIESYISGCDRIAEDIEPPVSDSELGAEPVPCEPTSEMYYTASSEVSLLSDMDLQDKAQSEDSDKERDDRNSVIAGHVAAMRERFESMTRTNTPCPDLIRSASPSFEVFRNFSTSPDHLE